MLKVRGCWGYQGFEGTADSPSRKPGLTSLISSLNPCTTQQIQQGLQAATDQSPQVGLLLEANKLQKPQP
jgi:hypothetical protein